MKMTIKMNGWGFEMRYVNRAALFIKVGKI